MEDESDDKDDTKRKSRNLSEKKRRDQFNTLVNDLSALISTSNRKMDKSTVLKSTIAFLKHHNEATDRSKVFEIQQDWKPSFLTNDEFTHLMLESLDGFIIVFSSAGSIFYASESITSLLGYVPSDLLNMSIFDLAYEMYHESLFNIFLNPKPVIEPLQTDINSSNQITFYVQLKRGGIEKVDANAYELVKFVGYFRNDANLDNMPMLNTQTPPRIFQSNPTAEVDKKLIFVGTGRIQTPQLIREMSATDPTQNEFTSKHSMEWKFLFLDHRAPPIIGYMPFEVLGTSGYDYYHFDDLDGIVACHEELMQKGEGKSCYYRFLTKGQQWIWLQTDFYVSYHQFNSKPDYVVCTHKVVSYGDVIKQSKSGNKSNKTLSVAASSAAKSSSTVTLRDLETNNQVGVDSTTHASPADDSGNAIADLLHNTSPTLDTASVWATGSTSTAVQLPTQKTSRPASSYGNISSAGISPTVKRKRYFHHSRGNESDSTSMSADSATSRHSLMTHLSSQSRQRHGSTSMQQLQQQQQSTAHPQQPNQSHVSSNMHQHLQTQPHSIQLSQTTSQPKLIPMLPQHSLASAQMLSSSACQFSQPAFPIRNPQIVGPTFLEPPQYLTAIPVQPVIAPFPVPPVLSPLPNPADLMSAGAVIMTPTQTQLQDQLQRKHDELQKLIMQQQDELRIVSEQLLLARYTLLQPVVPMNFNTGTAASNNRNFNFNSNVMEPQFNQYGFAINSEQMQNNQDQQIMMQQQQNLQHQQQQLQSHQQQQQQQTQQVQLQHNQPMQHQQQPPQQQQSQQLNQSQHQQQQQQSLLSRSVPDLEHFGHEEIDAFLNLSPLQSMTSQTGLNQISNNNSSNNNNTSNNQQQQQQQSLNHNYGPSAPQASNEDSLLSYMQMATDTSPTLNFQMGISDDGSETQSEDTKVLQGHHQHMQQRQQQQQQQQQHLHHHQQQQQHSNRSSFFSANAFQTLSNQTSNQLPNDLEILPYQMSQEQSQNLFNSPHASGTSQ